MPFHNVAYLGMNVEAFDVVGRGLSLGILLCVAFVPEPCPRPAAALMAAPSLIASDGPITSLVTVNGYLPELACCPQGYTRVTAVRGGGSTGIRIAEGIEGAVMQATRSIDGRAGSSSSEAGKQQWDADFNQGAGGDYVHLCASREREAGRSPITEIVAFTTPSAAQPYGDCPTGMAQVTGQPGGGNLNLRVPCTCAQRRTRHSRRLRPWQVSLAEPRARLTASRSAEPGRKATPQGRPSILTRAE